MAYHTPRKHSTGYLTFDVRLGASEVIIIPVTRSMSKNGDSTIAIMAPAGTKVSWTIEPPEVVQGVMKGRAFIASQQKDATEPPAVTDLDKFARIWHEDEVMAADGIYEMKAHATALRITAPIGGGFACLYGDY